ncbi:MAG TPA: acetyl-CoA carboxylase biotin carboxyl carrier protein subunit, partial [Thermomicrobiales bacterium]|nr:acetyl-CoA carboxylase biotin carboxyl carrier protein subunit [Thermomicrobiales bacterium]
PASTTTRRRQANDGRVRAPLPGKVLRISVEPGDPVEAGQPVVTLSAMKMELVCEAPVSGVVESVSCRVDEIVAADDVLAVIRTTEAKGADL